MTLTLERGSPKATPTRKADPVNTIKLSDVVFDSSIYPRERASEEVIKRYVEALEAGTQFPPIKLDQRNRLIDGKHRLTAFERADRQEIAFVAESYASDEDAYRAACRENSGHGQQMNRSERYKATLRMFEVGDEIKDISLTLGVPERTVRNWTEKLREVAELQRNEVIERMLREDATQKEIGEALGLDQASVSRIMQNGHFAKTHIVTIGYEGLTLETFLTRLKAAKVSHVWDVRDTNMSQFKPDFSGPSLKRTLEAAGIDYEHKKQLGVPSMLRWVLLECTDLLKDGAESFAAFYERHTAKQGVNFGDLKAELMGNKRTALLCMEAPGKPCHRYFLPDLLELKSEDVSRE